MVKRLLPKEELIYPDLSYQILGVLFEVQNELGNKYQEKHYQRALAIKLQKLGIPFKKEFMVKVKFADSELGKFFVDFIIDNKLILETKKVWRITHDDIRQVLRYLEATELKLAIIVNFSHRKLEYVRVINPLAKISEA